MYAVAEWGLVMTPFIKRNLLTSLSVFLFFSLLYLLNRVVPVLNSEVQHLEFIPLSIMIMIGLVIMLFWGLAGVFCGLISFLTAMVFLYRPLTDLNPLYYNVLILAYFISSFIGYHTYRKINVSIQEYTVNKEKITEDINLIRNHLKSRENEVAAMGKKIEDLLQLKTIADKLGLSLSEEEILQIVSQSTFNIFGGDNRVLLFVSDDGDNDLNLVRTVKPKDRKQFDKKRGGIFDRWAAKNMQGLLVKNVRNDFRFSLDEEEAQDDAVSVIVKPAMIGDRHRCVLRVDSPREAAFSQHELRIIDIIGDFTAIASENARLYRKTEELAIKDSLTGLYVHRYFMERLEGEIKRGLHSDTSFAFFMIDIDNFKDFNDKNGHIAGDAILMNIGEILNSKVSAGDTVARYGGEEFALLALNCNKKKAIELGNRIRTEIQESKITIRRNKCSVTVSIGIAVFPEDAKLKEDIIWEADRCLYKAKLKGKNKVEACSK